MTRSACYNAKLIRLIPTEPLMQTSEHSSLSTALIMFGRLMLTCVFGMCAVLAAGESSWWWSRWSPCSVTCGQTPGVRSRHKKLSCSVIGWCRTGNSEETGRCESIIPCVTPKPAACRCTPPQHSEPCCPRGET